jgi:hypothetical protein
VVVTGVVVHVAPVDEELMPFAVPVDSPAATKDPQPKVTLSIAWVEE